MGLPIEELKILTRNIKDLTIFKNELKSLHDTTTLVRNDSIVIYSCGCMYHTTYQPPPDFLVNTCLLHVLMEAFDIDHDFPR